MSVKSKNWFYLFATNFVGVFNDNFLKHAIIFIAIGWSLPSWLVPSQLISLVSAALVIPYLILTPLSGRLSMIYNKKRVLVLFKWLELPIVCVAILGYVLQCVWLPLLAVLLMGTQSCLYSPAKYGLIRDIGGKSGVSFGSGVFEMMAFLGILIGTMVASILSDHYNLSIFIIIILLLVFLGIWFSTSIKVEEVPTEEDRSSLNPFSFLFQCYRYAKAFPGLNISVFGASMLWFIGSLLQMNLVIHTTQTLGCSNTDSGFLLAISALGIALGCYVAGVISGNVIRTRFIFIGLCVMIFSLCWIIILKPSYQILFIPIFLTAFGGGFFQVPCLAIVQHSNVGRRLSDMLAYVNLVTFIFVLISSLLFSMTMQMSHDNSYALFGVILSIVVLTLILFCVKRNSLKAV